MIEMKQMIYALRLQEILYLVNVSRAAAHGYHMDGGSSVEFCHGFRHQHQVLALLDASHIEYKLIGKLVSCLYFLQFPFFYLL